jgi:hypothetical protein
MVNIKFEKREMFTFLLFILVFYVLFFLTGCDGCDPTPITPCNGILYSCHPQGCDYCVWTDNNQGACDKRCGAPESSHQVMPGKGVKGGCFFGQIVDENCFCKWVDMDLDSYSGIASGYGTEDDCNDFNSNVYPGAEEICNNMDDDCDGEVDEGGVCRINVFVCKTNNFDENSKNCFDGEFSSGSTTTNMLTISYHTNIDDFGENTFYTYVCDAYLGDGDYGCYYFVGGKFEVVRNIFCDNDGYIDEGEECDINLDTGLVNIGGKTCENFGYTGGLLGCDFTCNFDFSNCVGSNNCDYDNQRDIENGEECDGSDLNLRGCGDFGLRGAGLKCNSNCQYDFSECECSEWSVCGSLEDDRTRFCPSADGFNVVMKKQPCIIDDKCGPEDDLDNDTYFSRNCWDQERGISSFIRGLDCDDTNSEINPGTGEICDYGLDNDCDGSADVGCNCMVGETLVCGTNEGVCRKGIQLCVGGIWGACGGAGYVGPVDEVCGNGLDDNCDGYIDEGCFCTEGDVQECGSDIGICQKGNQTCINNAWSVCNGEITPFTEICNDGLDNDCDGYTDDEDLSCKAPDRTGEGEEGGSSVKIIEKIPMCEDGKITSKCKCGDKIYTRGYCYSNSYSRKSRGGEIYTPAEEDTFITEKLSSEEREGSNFWVWFLIIIILLGLVVFVGLYKKGKIKLKFINKYFRRVPFVNNIFKKAFKYGGINDLIDYFDRSLKKGKNRQLLISKALQKGWKKSDIDAALKEVDSKHNRFKPLIDYVKRAFEKGLKKKKIKKDVLKSGWDKEDFNFAYRNIKKK